MRGVGRSLLALGLLAGLAAGSVLASGEPVRVLLLSGQNNHDWTATTPELEAILGESGSFEVDVTEEPEALTARSLEPYDVIVSNWNAFGLDPTARAGRAETREAYLDFVRQGKGHVVVHAGSSSFDRLGGLRATHPRDLEDGPDEPRAQPQVPGPDRRRQPPRDRRPRGVHHLRRALEPAWRRGRASRYWPRPSRPRTRREPGNGSPRYWRAGLAGGATSPSSSATTCGRWALPASGPCSDVPSSGPPRERWPPRSGGGARTMVRSPSWAPPDRCGSSAMARTSTPPTSTR